LFIGEFSMKPKIGKFRVPKIRLKILLEELNKLYKKYGENTFTITQFADALDISLSSSGKEQKKFELKNLGLLKGDDNSLKITESGIKIVQQISPDRQKEIESVVKRISLWGELFSAGKNLNDAQLFILLQNKTGIPESTLKERFKEIKWAFNEDVDCITQFDPNKQKTVKPHNHTIVKHHISAKQLENATSLPQAIFKDEPIINTNENKRLILTPISWKVSTGYGEFETEIIDELSLHNARCITIQLLDTIEKKITNKQH
jgi:hypothetical protein